MVDYLVLDHLSNLKRATYTVVRVSGHVITNYCKVLVMSGVFPQFALRDFKIQRRGRQRKRQKKKKQTKTKTKGFISKTTTSHVHHTFLYISLPASYPDVSLSMKICAQRKAGRRQRARRASPAVCTFPMVPCGSLPVTRVSRSPLLCEKRSA